ncbi:MAG: hypothetical protein WBM97_05940 [Sedimenticolaceae bacterium]
MKSPEHFLVDSRRAAIVFAVLLVVVLVAYLATAFRLKAAPNLVSEKDRHSLIAISCPYAPYFGTGGSNGREWRLIVSAFLEFGQQVQHLYVSYEDALRYFESDEVEGVWVCGGMGMPDMNYYPSAPLLERRFVVATLAETGLEFEQLDALEGYKVGIHPDVLRVLQPQTLQRSEDFEKIANHVLLASLLFTERIDALITEESVFNENLRLVPRAADPAQPIQFHLLFKPVFPRIMFKDQALRDRFDKALQKVTVSRIGDS